MDPVTLLICVGAIGWIVRALAEDVISAWRGVPSPRIARREARQRLELERIAAGGSPPLTIVFSQRLADRIAHPPERRWLNAAREYMDTVIADGFEDARYKHTKKRRERAAKYPPPGQTEPNPESSPVDSDDDIVDAEVVHERTPADGDPAYTDASRIPGLPCRACWRTDQPLSVDNRCRRCVRGKFGFSHYCVKGCGEPTEGPGQTCPSCAAGRFVITCGCCGTARTQPECPVCTEGGTCPLCLPSPSTKPEPTTPPPAPADTPSPAPVPAPEPTRKDTSVMSNTPAVQSGTIINGDVGDPESAVAYCENTLSFNQAVYREVEVALGNLRAAGLGQEFLDIIGSGIGAADEFKGGIEAARAEYADHVIAKADLTSRPDLRDTLLGYLSASRG